MFYICMYIPLCLRSFHDLSFGFDLRALPASSAVFFGSHEEVLEEGYRLTGLRKEEVLSSQVVDLFMIPGISGLQAGWWLLDLKAQVIGQPDLWSVRWRYFFYYSNPAIFGMLCAPFFLPLEEIKRGMWIGRAGCRYCSKTGTCLCDWLVSTLWSLGALLSSEIGASGVGASSRVPWSHT